MANQKIVLTKSGMEKLQAELKERIEVIRPEIIEKIKVARAQGDLSENAEFDAAKEEQSQNEGRIEELKAMLDQIEIAPDVQDTTEVAIGTKVTVREEGEDEDEVYYIVGESEANSREHKVSGTSPFGQALIGAKKNKVVTFNAPGGVFKYKIRKIEIA